jgi:putative flippase GtrA
MHDADIGVSGSGERIAWLVLARHQVGALAATIVDFTTMIVWVHTLGASPVLGTAIGAACGAVTNFVLARRWIFRDSAGGAPEQALRYALVSLGSLGLNALGEFVAHDVAGIPYVLARVLVALAVGVCWNFPAHRAFAFPRTRA